MQNFIEIPFPTEEEKNIVYILGIKKEDEFIPFYVGQSSRNFGRFGDYISANFSASTDFKVGTAIKLFFKKNKPVSIRYRKAIENKIEENKLISEFRINEFKLLNDISNYDYKTANQIEIESRIENFVDEFILKHF